MEDNQSELLHDLQLMAEAVHKLDIAVQMILDAAEAQLKQLKKIISQQQKEQFGEDSFPYFGPKGEA